MLVTALSEVIAKMRTTTACTRSIRGRRQAARVDEGGRSANVTMANHGASAVRRIHEPQAHASPRLPANDSLSGIGTTDTANGRRQPVHSHSVLGRLIPEAARTALYAIREHGP
jgi:hypothetical protein